MAKIVSIHSFRRGVGKSILAANIAMLASKEGKKVGVVDADLQLPGLHVLFGFDEEKMEFRFNDFLKCRCSIEKTVYDLTARYPDIAGKIYIIPASTQLTEIAQSLREVYDIHTINQGFSEVINFLGLDLLVLDTSAGITEDTLTFLALSDILVVVLQPDEHDFQGTAVIVDIARKLEVPKILLVTNMVAHTYDLDNVKNEVERTYECESGAVLPLSEDMAALANGEIFSRLNPDHPISVSLRQMTERLLA